MEEKTLAGAIRRGREDRGLSQEKLAELVSVSRQAVSKWETGLAVPTEENLRRLEQALELEEGSLSAWSGQIAPETGRPKRNWPGLAAGALAAVLVGFAVGRLTAPPPPQPLPEEEPTKTIWKYTEYHDTGGGIEHTEHITYNEMGEMLRREVKDGDQVFLQEAEYDERGNRIVYRSYYPEEVMNYSNEMEYDERGNRLVTRRLNGAGELEYWIEQAFDERGEQTRYQKFNAQGEIQQSERWVHTYFEDGSHQKDYFVPSVDESEPTRIVQLNDAHGNILSITKYDVEGNVVSAASWTYQPFEVPADYISQY